MTARHTFHTPSFGDEEFQLPESQVADPPYDGQAQVGQWQSFSVHGGTHNTGGGGMYGDPGVTSGDDSDENGTKNVKYSAQDAVSANMGEKKKKRDPNEPKKPVSAYALFFRDTQAAIKVQNPNASFGEVSKVVASMWDALDPEHKNVYKKKTEAAKKEYLKSLAAYRANALSRGEAMNNHSSPPHNEVAASPKAATVKAPPAVVKITRVENNENLIASAPNESQNDFQNNSLNTQQPPKQSAVEQQHLNMASAPAGNQLPENVDQTISTQKCIRDGCSNIAIVNPDWEDEYCSNECVIVHCRNVFTNWVQANVQTEAYPAS